MLYTFRLALLLWLAVTGWIKDVRGQGADLKQPPVVDFTGGDSQVETFVVRYWTKEVTNPRDGNRTVVKMNTRMYCWEGASGCTFPAATFILHPGVPAIINLCNALTGLGAEILNDSFVRDMGYTPYKDMDVINLHTHGLNVNPSEDNVVTRWLNPFCPPGYVSSNQFQDCVMANANRTNYQCQLYNFTLPKYHYPGSHWWHTHQHGSVTFQVAGGMFGPIEVKPYNETMYPPAMNSSWFMINYLFLGNNGTCACPSPQTCDTGTMSVPFPSPPRCTHHPNGKNFPNNVDRIGFRAGFPVVSRCMLYCLYTEEARNASGGDMTLEMPQNDASNPLSAYLVNGQYQPTKTLNVGEWHRFRIVMTTLTFLFLKLPPVDKCDSYLLGQDGIDFPDVGSAGAPPDATGPRNINAAPYFGSIVMPIGGRADVAIRCKTAGTYNLTALTASIATRNGAQFVVSSKFSPQNQQALEELSQSSTDCLGGGSSTGPMAFGMPTATTDLLLADLNVVGSGTVAAATPPTNNVPYADCPYLKDTRPESVQTGFTVDAVSGAHADTVMMTPNIVFPARPFQNPSHQPNFTNLGLPWMATGMNNVSYSEHNPLFTFQTNVVHEWTVFIRYHPFHHHTWPYQVQSSFPNWLDREDGNQTLIQSSGWFAKGGDWRDVVGLYGSLIVRVNYVANGSLAHDILNNKLVIHCHYVFHEDFGMMQWFQMNQTAVPALTYSPGNTEFSIDNSQQPATVVINAICTATGGNFSVGATKFITGKTIVDSAVLGTSFGLELGEITVGGSSSFYAIFSGTSRPNVHNFFVTYGVSVTTQPVCSADVGIALRLQVFRNSTTQLNDHFYQAIPVDINPPHIVIPTACQPFLPIQCELITETSLPSTAQFRYRVFCTFNLTAVPAGNACGSVAQFRNIFDGVGTTLTRRGFSWSYGEGIGSSQFPMYTNANVQSCPIEFSEIPPSGIFGGANATQTNCRYGYFNLEATNTSAYNFSICSQFSLFPTRNPTVPAPAPSSAHRYSTFGVGLVLVVATVAW